MIFFAIKKLFATVLPRRFLVYERLVPFLYDGIANKQTNNSYSSSSFESAAHSLLALRRFKEKKWTRASENEIRGFFFLGLQ